MSRVALATLQPRLTTLDLRTIPAEDRTHKKADGIYATPEYRRWRAIIIARARGICQAPGCGRAEPRMFADHIVELRDQGDPYDVNNGQCLCGSCHTIKTAAARARRLGWGD